MQYTIEGYVDYRGDFDMGVIIAKPFVAAFDTISLDATIEDLCIDKSLGDEWEDEDDPDIRRRIQNSFYKVRKKNTINMRYFKRVVEIYPDDENKVYEVLESVGNW